MTAYKKGLEFELEVANFVKNELKFDDVEVRPRVSGKNTDRGYEIDVLAKEIDNRGEKISSLSVKLYIIGIVLIVFSILDYLLEWNIVGIGFIIVGFVPIVGSLLYSIIGKSKNMNDTYVWIECKNLKTKVKRTVISELTHKYDDYNLQKDKNWNINRLMAFSSSGYDHDAKVLAKSKGVILYEKDDNGKFIKTKLNF